VPAPHFILVEPYDGGSHRAFIDGLRKHSRFRFHLLTLPARKWKMRMQLAAPWAAEEIVARVASGSRYSGIICSTFIDVAVLRSLLFKAGISLPVAVYFHENQFGYPDQMNDPGKHQFTAINFTSALTADHIAFNSRYNRDTFFTGVRRYLKKAADTPLLHLADNLAAKSIILYPGIDFSAIDAASRALSSADHAPVIVWNHRWEHDKDPETFFSGLFDLSRQGIQFRLIVLGQHFEKCPQIFSKARHRLKKEIIHFGYAKSREVYAQWLARGDIIVSTAKHEFFGMAVLEGIRAGCRPLVPDRLSYPELFPPRFRYRPGTFSGQLKKLLDNPDPLSADDIQNLSARFAWPVMAIAYDKWLGKMGV